MPTPSGEPKDCDPGLLYGVPAIAVHLKVRPRQAHHMIDKGGLPTFRIAGKVCARVSAIKAWLAAQELAASETTGRAA